MPGRPNQRSSKSCREQRKDDTEKLPFAFPWASVERLVEMLFLNGVHFFASNFKSCGAFGKTARP